MLMETIDGKGVDFIKQLTANEMLELFGAKLTPNRQKCCLLAWKVLQSAIYSVCDDGASGDLSHRASGPSLAEES